MRLLAHVSDLHFGAEDPHVADGLVVDLLERRPFLVAVSGDLTQRARGAEFRAARAFLDRIPFPQVVVPGNHDIPFYDVVRRFLFPLHRFRALISADLSPFLREGDVAVLGVNTARSFTLKSGRVSHEQIAHIRQTFRKLPEELHKVVVTHHPFLPPEEGRIPRLVGRALPALEALDEAGVDLLLAGHLHVGYHGDVRRHHTHVRRSILVAQAGTAISRRNRGEPNSYNLIGLDGGPRGGRVTIEVRTWSGTAFCATDAVTYEHDGREWLRIP